MAINAAAHPAQFPAHARTASGRKKFSHAKPPRAPRGWAAFGAAGACSEVGLALRVEKQSPVAWRSWRLGV